MTKPTLETKAILPRLAIIYSQIPKRRRLHLVILAVLSGITAICEMVAVGAILPFIAALQDPLILQKYNLGRIALDHFHHNISTVLTLFFCSAVALAAAVRVIYLWAGVKVSFRIGSELTYELYKRALNQPYAVHISRSSNEVLDVISYGVNTIVSEFLIPCVNIVGAIFAFSCILFLLFIIDPLIASTSFLGIGLIYVLIGWVVRKKTARNSQDISLANRMKLKNIQEGMGGMRDIIINSMQFSYLNRLSKLDTMLTDARTSSRVISGTPRYIIEAAGLVIVANLANIMSDSGSLNDSIPVLAAFAIGAQRLLPALQTVYSGWASIKTSFAYLDKVAKYILSTASPNITNNSKVVPLKFSHRIKLENVEFKYSRDGASALKSISIEIPKGRRIGIIGSSGSGKSTLVDMLMALLEPTHGKLIIDDQEIDSKNRAAWQANICHVPQSVYLIDGTIEENIAFADNNADIDPIRVRNAAAMAQIDKFIDTLDQGYKSMVGERGIRLSGGQRQRIGIARALYRESQVLVFDEATSALDSETERSVMESIDGLSNELTIIMIAHRISTLSCCDQVISMKDGKIVNIGTFQEVSHSA